MQKSLEEPKLVKITHVVNPSRFYCRFASSDSEREEIDLINNIERAIKDYVTKFYAEGKQYEFYEPKKLDLVAYYSRNNNKWIRCVVDELLKFVDEKTMVLWSVDYGLPLYTTSLNDLVPLPFNFRKPTSRIFAAGLPVLPATIRFDHVNCKTLREFYPEWSERSVKLFRDLIESKAGTDLKIYFTRSTAFSHPELLIGDLLIYDDSLVQYGISSRLLEEECAVIVPSDQFMKYQDQLLKIERWNDNRRSGGVLKNVEGSMQASINLFEVVDSSNDVGYDGSTVGRYEKISVQKVKKWMNKNENVSADESSMYLDSSAMTSGVPEIGADDTQMTDNGAALQKKREKNLQPNRAGNQSSVGRKMVFLAAGAPMNTNDRNPKYVDYDTSRSRFSTKAGSIVSDNFISASQVGCDDTESNVTITNG